MRVKIYVINETGGCFTASEEKMCIEYCKQYGYTYRVEYIKTPA